MVLICLSKYILVQRTKHPSMDATLRLTLFNEVIRRFHVSFISIFLFIFCIKFLIEQSCVEGWLTCVITTLFIPLIRMTTLICLLNGSQLKRNGFGECNQLDISMIEQSSFRYNSSLGIRMQCTETNNFQTFFPFSTNQRKS